MLALPKTPYPFISRLTVLLISVACGFTLIQATAAPYRWNEPLHDTARDEQSKLHRKIVTLQDGWEIQPAGSTEWLPIEIGDSWERTLGVDFDGVATYRIRLPQLPIHDGRSLLRFDAVATHCTVFLNGEKIGEHLGGWTPFQFDLTGRELSSGTLTIEVDERVGHNTQGFLPVFIPHFGGIWKPVEIILTPARVTFDDLQLYAAGWSPDDTIEIATPLIGTADQGQNLRLGAKIITDPRDGSNVNNPTFEPNQDLADDWVWCPIERPQADSAKGDLIASGPQTNEQAWPKSSQHRIELKPNDAQRWNPSHPHLYRIEIVIHDLNSGTVLERIEVQAALRHVEVDGAQLLLNGKPVQIRGVLNWGYAPPRLAPTLDEDFMRQELETIREAGFNLMKFCLWIPPKRYLELCDELGILAWVEYPTWHPKLTGQFLQELETEYDEFYAYDRNHPSVILRSLTCETGPSAELSVIQRLYDQAHASVPYCIVEDDSSWIGWNRVHDFYDDHPYGNNHTWKSTLKRLRDHIAERELKPLMLGEAIAADTWTARDTARSGDDPRWTVHELQSLHQQAAFLHQVEQLVGDQAVERLSQDALTTALRMRKFQIETYRQQLPDQGYVVSVIRDFPFAAMGLIDFAGRFKWPLDEWAWHGPTILKLNTEQDRRSCYGGEEFQFSIEALGAQPKSIELQLQWRDENQPFYSADITLAPQIRSSESPYGFAQFSSSDEVVVAIPQVEVPRAAWLNARAKGSQQEITNRWAVWVVPSQAQKPASTKLRRWSVHSSVDQAHKDCPTSLKELPLWSEDTCPPKLSAVVTRKLDEALLAWLRAGGRVLLLSAGDVGAPPVADHWFLRGGVIVAEQSVLSPNDADLIAELQTFDLAGPVMMSPDYLGETTPIALLWDNHDRDEYRMHALAWMTQVGEGRLLVSSLETSPARGPATQYLVDLWKQLLEEQRDCRSFSSENNTRLLQDIVDVRVELPQEGWLFLPDRNDVGEQEKWFAPAHDRKNWRTIRIGTAWDGQGYDDLDGFGWYARRVTLPHEARFLTFTGVDDSFDLWIDGSYIGKGGDRETRVDAFSRFVTLPIPESSWGHDSIFIVVRVDDWQGAGGIFRPVFVSKSPLKNQSPILRRQQTVSGER